MSLSAHAVLVVVLGAALHATGAAQAVTGADAFRAADAAPWFGTWQLEAPKTAPRWFETLPYTKVTLTIEPTGQAPRQAPGERPREGLRVTYDMVRTRGGITHMEWLGRFDARDYPVQGVAYFMTNAYRQIDDRSYEIAIKVDGAPAGTATVVISSDGATMTVATVETAGGKSTAVYRRR